MEAYTSAWLRDKAEEAGKSAGAADCPFEPYLAHRQDQAVAEWAHCSTMDARVLAESELDLFNDYLFLAVATSQARIIADAIADANAKNKAKHEETARASVRM